MLTAGEVQVVFPDEGAALNYLSCPLIAAYFGDFDQSSQC